MKVISPAKVNLFLAVAAKQGEYHPVLNILHTLLLHDVLYINYQKADALDISIEFLENEDSNGERPEIKLEDNLIYKAITALAAHATHTNYKIEVFVEKNIPLQAGLAGGSSNAAAALVGAGKIFGLKDEVLAEVAAEVGADVAFFLNGGCALYKGRGETLDHKLSPINREIVLVRPFNDEGLSTKAVYDKFDTMGVASDFQTKFEDDMTVEDAAQQLQFADNVPLFNNLALASEVLAPELVEIKNWLAEKCGAENVLLCGSGSATLAIIEESGDSDKIVEEARGKGYWAIATQLANVRARIVPNVTEY
ncbi:MAG: 4-(cytidine 5'-diphospho)-2-C-methyl-D-erythritol kinase [Coriobacteriia bacterium]|nr:4-(cytidine 5'-diphospho)-2-C-methyl-D-erythritol kinase [Coriobacteriia bacterium]